MILTSEPLDDFLAHDAEQEAALKRLPVCDDCGNYIQTDDYYYEISGRKICPKCIEDYRVWID